MSAVGLTKHLVSVACTSSLFPVIFAFHAQLGVIPYRIDHLVIRGPALR